MEFNNSTFNSIDDPRSQMVSQVVNNFYPSDGDCADCTGGVNSSFPANLESEFMWTTAKEVANLILLQATGKHLSDIEIKVLRGSWEGKTYDQIASFHGYSAEYLNKDVGNKLWSKLSDILGEKVTKKNFKETLGRAWEEQQKSRPKIQMPSSVYPISEPAFPEGAVALDSPLYQERFGVESLCYQTVTKPGSLIRIKAPNLMGKTSLMMRILAHATHQKYRAIYLDLGGVDRSILTDLDNLLRWLCLMVSRQLNLENQLHEYWDTDILGSNDNCTAYFEEYLLAAIDGPLVLGLDDVDRLFSYNQVVEDFLGLLRSWHEKAKIAEIWKQLRLVITHSTEVYISLDINQSPFNAGLPVELSEFDQQQIRELTHLHRLNWTDNKIDKLMEMVGGHPYLVRLGIYEIASGKVTLAELLEGASTEAGIYSNHLRRHLKVLQQIPNLAKAMKDVVASFEPVELDSLQIYKLHSMGLIERQGNRVIPRYQLYREYFSRVLVENPQ